MRTPGRCVEASRTQASSSWLRSTGSRAAPAECANSRMSRAMAMVRSTPSSDSSISASAPASRPTVVSPSGSFWISSRSALQSSCRARRLLRTYAIGVLISCAMPAASCPTASIFCASRRRRSSSLRSVMSSARTSAPEIFPLGARKGVTT